VRIYKAEDSEPKETWPRYDAVPAAPGTALSTPRWRAWFAGRGTR
jgi:hypothetical protein